MLFYVELKTINVEIKRSMLNTKKDNFGCNKEARETDDENQITVLRIVVG